jgi:NAD(P)-dependent dehydrogenase (short-subunit alcohol dehydrogenase family)
MAATVLGRFSTIDVLVNAAGTNMTRRSLAEYSAASFDEVLATNLQGVVRCTMAFLPAMRRQGGTIININSEAGRLASARAGAAYVASKFGLTGFTQTLNLEERANRIRACSIFPGDVDTPLVDRRPNPPPPEARAKFLRPEDIANAAWFVVSMPPHAVVEELLIRQA